MNHLYLYFYRFLLLVVVIASPSILYAQDSVINGVVTDEATGEPIPGVNIIIEGTTTGTVSDINGQFQLNAPQDATIVFSSVGFATETIPVNGRAVIDISLAQDVQSLSEVIVVGYGTQERARVTGAISSVSSEEISALPVASLDQALQGRAAGISVANTGSPGVSPIVRIRGLGTVGNNDPLYVIDGMPVSGGNATGGTNNMSSSGGINSINPNDIESIQILKDASAAAIYGSRAANGVILITTKKGSKGKTNINLDAYIGIQTAWNQLDLLNSDQYVAYGKDLTRDTEAGIPARLNDLGEYANVETDWQDEMFRTAPIQDYNVSITGGGENSLFNVGGGYFKQEGIMLGTGFERYSMRANSEFTLGKFKVGETLTLSLSERKNEPYNGGRSQIEHMIKMVPYIPVRDADYLGGFRATDAMDGTDPENPVLNAYLRRNVDKNVKVLGTAYATYEILDGLQYKILLGLDLNLGYNDQFTPRYAPSDTYHLNPTADINQTRSQYISPLISNQLSFDKTFGKHTLGAIAVIERQTSTFATTGGAGETALTDDLEVLSGLENPAITGTKSEYALISYLGRVNYDYNGKYLFAASVRRDGGSRFGTEKWGTFPAVSAGWRLSEEAFMADFGFISDFKLRGSWGKTGNDAIGNYVYQATIDGQHPYILGGALVPGYTLRALANPDVQWETTTMTNIGLDLGFMNESLRASLEYFHNETEDMLLSVPIPPSLGYDVAPVFNVGSAVNKGFELSLGYYKSTGDFQWSLNGNVSFVKNELTSLGVGNSITGQQFEGYNTTFAEEGEPIGYFHGWVVDGIFQSQAEIDQANALDGNESSPYQVAATSPGDIRFKDLNGDGAITNDDRTNLGHYLPDFSYGLSGSANYKNFDLSIFVQGVSGNEILNLNRYDLEGMTRLFNSGTAVLDRWTPTNTDTDVPRAIATDPNGNARVSSRFVEDGSYLRIKNLAIGYTLPSGILNSFGKGFIKNIRIYVSTQNLLTITDYTGYDPEIGVRPDLANNANSGNPGNSPTLNSGVDYGQYPQARTFIGGIQIGF